MTKFLVRIILYLKQIQVAARKPTYGPKVFCIGYNKTGTTTVGKSLEMLGYRHTSFNEKVWKKYYKNWDIEKLLDYTARFDSTDDLPWLKEDMIPILDKRFPNSKFIYLWRDEQTWLASLKNWSTKTGRQMLSDEKNLQLYRHHQRFVHTYFANRLGTDLLVLRVDDPQGFQKIATFLSKNVIYSSFPHFNKT